MEIKKELAYDALPEPTLKTGATLKNIPVEILTEIYKKLPEDKDKEAAETNKAAFRRTCSLFQLIHYNKEGYRKKVLYAIPLYKPVTLHARSAISKLKLIKSFKSFFTISPTTQKKREDGIREIMQSKGICFMLLHDKVKAKHYISQCQEFGGVVSGISDVLMKTLPLFTVTPPASKAGKLHNKDDATRTLLPNNQNQYYQFHSHELHFIAVEVDGKDYTQSVITIDHTAKGFTAS